MSDRLKLSDRNFSNFVGGDDPIKLSDGVVGDLADKVGMPFRDGGSVEELRALIAAIGPNKVLRDNETLEGLIQIREAAELVSRSGLLEELKGRSLWSPDTVAPVGTPVIMSGGVANWMDRTASVVTSTPTERVIVPVGNRVMASSTELTNPNHQQMVERLGRNPTEAEYAQEIATRLREGHKIVDVFPYETGAGDEIARKFVEDNPELFNGNSPIAVARVAGAGIQLAMQMRRAARTINPGFDRKSNPQLFVYTDTIPVARTEEQLRDPAHFQSPYSALRQLAVTSLMLQDIRSK